MEKISQLALNDEGFAFDPRPVKKLAPSLAVEFKGSLLCVNLARMVRISVPVL